MSGVGERLGKEGTGRPGDHTQVTRLGSALGSVGTARPSSILALPSVSCPRKVKLQSLSFQVLGVELASMRHFPFPSIEAIVQEPERPSALILQQMVRAEFSKNKWA